MTNKLTITRGLPGSGKSTWARAWKDEAPTRRIVVGRDQIRLDFLNMTSTLGDKHQETLVTGIQRQIVQESLLNGWDVVVDDTNLPQRRAKDWADLAQRCRANFAVQDFTHIDLEVCIGRDRKRIGSPKFVGDAVIKSMHSRFLASGKFEAGVEARVEETVRQYEPDTELEKDCFIFDIDGTLAKMTGRSPFEWHRVGEDDVIWWVQRIAVALSECGYHIVCLSGRDEACRALTEEWLARYHVPYDELFMRPQGDHRKDSIIKSELFFDKVAPNYYVHGVFDDRNQVVEFWRSIGVPCAQVALGDF